MSGDRKTRRRFIADALFAGGALTAASWLGYNATHKQEKPICELTPTVVDSPTPACTPREDMRPAGEMEAPPPPAPSQAPREQAPIPAPMHPGGAVAPHP